MNVIILIMVTFSYLQVGSKYTFLLPFFQFIYT